MMAGNKYILAQAATGFGKSIIGASMIQSAQAKGNTSWFLVPRRELIKQMTATFSDFEIPHSFIASGYEQNPYSKTHIVSLGTIIRRIPTEESPGVEEIKNPPKILFVDETHYGGKSLDTIINYMKARGTIIVGLSATPWLLSGKGLGCWYDDMVQGPSVAWLIENKYLSEYRGFAPSAPDLSGIKTVAGDYAKGQLADKMEQDRFLIGNAVSHYKEKAMWRLNVAFCVSRKHSELTVQEFRDAGIPAQHIGSDTPDNKRKEIIRAYARREILVLTCVDLLTFGFDLASQVGMDVTVEAMSDLRPTKSLALQMQKWGRVLRKKDHPAIIFDHAGNFTYHGMPCADRDWTLMDREKKIKAESESTVKAIQCDNCFYVRESGPMCPECGAVAKVNFREVKQKDGVLEEVDPKKLRQQQKYERLKRQHECKTLDDLIAFGQSEGMKYPAQWASRIWASREAKKLEKEIKQRSIL